VDLARLNEPRFFLVPQPDSLPSPGNRQQLRYQCRPNPYFDAKRPRILLPAFQEFLLQGARYAFPALRGSLVAGVPTVYAAAPLNAHIAPSADPLPVWPSMDGAVRGIALFPLYPSAPAAALRSPALYEYLALFDALRAGNVRERTLARRLFEERL
jgi:hypothetical protein